MVVAAPLDSVPIAGLPVPPFASHDDHATFLRVLALYVARLTPGPAAGIASVVLSGLVTAERAALDRGDAETEHLSQRAMHIATNTLFPAPFTPHGLALELQRHRALGWDASSTITPTLLEQPGDPVTRATRRADGSWHRETIERGLPRDDADAADDWQMVMLLMDGQRGFAFPFGWATDPAETAAAERAALTTLRAWEQHARLAYLQLR